MNNPGLGGGVQNHYCDPDTNVEVWLRVCFRHHNLLHWIATLHPVIQSAEQRTHTCDASLFQLQRHPGAGRFVWSSAIENDVAIAWDFDVTILELLWS